VLGVVGGVDEGERAAAGPPPELHEPWALATKLLDVTPPEFIEATRLVPEPSSELGARRQFPIPLIEPGLIAGDSSRPEAVNQDAIAIR
jgi:hypothetical protein